MSAIILQDYTPVQQIGTVLLAAAVLIIVLGGLGALIIWWYGPTEDHWPSDIE